jgi:hypothetical protein
VAGPAGPKGPAGNVSAQGYDISVLWAAVHQDWSNKNFDGKDLSGIEIEQKGEGIIENSSFRNANLQDTSIDTDGIINCNFSGANILTEFSFGPSIIRNCNFKGAIFKISSFSSDAPVDWRDIDSIEEFVRPIFINCTMPDGSKKNDPEP